MNLLNKKTNRTMPDCSIIPVLTYADVEAAITWLCNTYGFNERWRAGNHRAQLSYGNSVIVVTARNDKEQSSRYSLLVRVESIMQHFEYVKSKGVKILQMPQEYPYGEKQYTAHDIEGHVWTFSESVQDVLPEDWGGISKNVL
jgi:uncharacterized glyoxalase superfamily protein PhnB